MNQYLERPFWIAGTFNNHHEVKKDMKIPPKVALCDLTLDEDGEGMAGAYMTEEEKVEIAEMLDEMGIQRIGLLGFPAPISKGQVDSAKRIRNMGLKAKFQTLATSKEDINYAIELGLWGVIIRKPVSDIYSIEKEPKEKKISDFIELAQYVRRNGMRVGMMAQDITRADPEVAKDIIVSIHKNFGLDELCITDTLGIANPFSFFFLNQKVKTWVDVPISVHCHNYLGMAVSNACAAVAGGAEIVHATINGLGHYAGLTALEEVAVALKIAYDVDVGIKYEKLFDVSKLVEKYSGIKMHPHKPITGDMAFSKSEEAKDIQNYLNRKRAGELKAHFAYLPEFVGNRSKVVMAEKVTPLGIKVNLVELGIETTEAQLRNIHRKVKDLSMRERRMISQDELRKNAEEVLREKEF